MKNLVYQFYNEGFATTFCIKPINYINKRIKNKDLIKTFEFIIKFIYTVLVLLILIVVIYLKMV